jgi:hypothetical protein
MNQDRDDPALVKERFKLVCERKILTTMMGAISRFEDFMGHMWGKGADDGLTDEQLQNLERWKLLRKEIMDNGHKQLRGLKCEIDQHNLTLNRTKIVFTMRNSNGNR